MNEFEYDNKKVKFPEHAHGYFRSFWERGVFYEQEMLEHIRQYSKPGIFIDVGSNTGNHSLYFLLFCKTDKCYSFEPNKEHIKSFTDLMNFNNLKNVCLFNFALSDHEGMAEVTYVINKTKEDRTAVNECHTLDNVLKENKSKVSVIKIDVEGRELKVLKGATSTLIESDARLYIECIGQNEFDNVEIFLNSLGYRYTGFCFNHTPTYEFKKYC